MGEPIITTVQDFLNLDDADMAVIEARLAKKPRKPRRWIEMLPIRIRDEPLQAPAGYPEENLNRDWIFAGRIRVPQYEATTYAWVE